MLSNIMEHKIGTKITLEVVENKEDSCEGCFFFDKHCTDYECQKIYRTDHKNIIYKKIEEK